MNRYQMPLTEALQYVKQRRRVISPNSGFISQLTLYETKIGLSNLSDLVNKIEKEIVALCEKISNQSKCRTKEKSVIDKIKPFKLVDIDYNDQFKLDSHLEALQRLPATDIQDMERIQTLTQKVQETIKVLQDRMSKRRFQLSSSLW